MLVWLIARVPAANKTYNLWTPNLKNWETHVMAQSLYLRLVIAVCQLPTFLSYSLWSSINPMVNPLRAGLAKGNVQPPSSSLGPALSHQIPNI